MDAPEKPRHIPIRPDWLERAEETVVDPDLPIVDAHHHLWDRPGNRYLPDELRADIASGHKVVATVFMEGKDGYRPDGPQELRPVGETEMVVAATREANPPCIAAGIVGYADLALGERVGDVLDAHVEAGRGRFRGIRFASAWHADPEARGSVHNHPAGLLYDPAVRRGLAELERRHLVYDAWLYHTQLGDLVDLAHAMPGLTIVINHVGGPIGIGPYAGRRAEVFEHWRFLMGRLARFPNVHVKLGGFGMLMAGFDFHQQPLPPSSDALAAAWGGYMRACIDLFTPARCMFESNFPVDKGTVSYRTLWNAFKKMTADASPADRHALFFQTANSVYGLGLHNRLAAASPGEPDRGRR